MQQYLAQFLAYSMAMVGLIAIFLLVYKHCFTNFYNCKKDNDLSIENALRISPKKQILVIKVGNERFLIAADAESTTMLAKLNQDEFCQDKVIEQECDKSNNIDLPYEKDENSSVLDFQSVSIKPMMKRINKKMKA